MSAASADPPLDLMQILFTIIFPVVGGLLGFALSLCPLLALPTIERTKRLGGFNPRPSCVFLCTAVLWCVYGVVIGNAFVFCAVRVGRESVRRQGEGEEWEEFRVSNVV